MLRVKVISDHGLSAISLTAPAKQEQNDKSNCRVIACEYLKRMRSFDLNLVFSTDKFNMIAIRGKMAEVLRKQSE